MDRESLPGEVSRRKFLGSSAVAALAAPFAARAVGANDKIAVGMIGIGIRGSQLLERLYAGSKDTATVAAICDAYTGNLAKAGARIQDPGRQRAQDGTPTIASCCRTRASTPSSSPRPSICIAPC